MEFIVALTEQVLGTDHRLEAADRVIFRLSFRDSPTVRCDTIGDDDAGGNREGEDGGRLWECVSHVRSPRSLAAG